MSAITKHQDSAAILRPTTLGEAMEFAKLIASSDLAPKDYRGKPGNVIVAIQMGAELGLAPMQAVQNIAVINGRPSVWGDALLALVQGHAECEDVIETSTATVATCTVKRRGREPVTRTFSLDDAKKAGLLGKQGPWTQYQARMMQMRARGFACRDAFADVLKGIHSAEESQDIPPEVRATVREVPRPETSRSKSEPPPAALPSSVPAEKLRAVIDMPTDELDPFDYVMVDGKNKGKALRDLANNQLHWYAEEFVPKSAEGERAKRYARQVIDARIAEREQKTREAVESEGADSWGLGGGNEAIAEAEASAHD